VSKFDRDKRRAYLKELANGVRRGQAACNVGVHRTTVIRAMKRSPRFTMAMHAAERLAIESVENAVFRAAVDKLNMVAAIFFLTNRDPEHWRDRRNPQSPLEAFLAALPADLMGPLGKLLSGGPAAQDASFASAIKKEPPDPNQLLSNRLEQG
jgi:hypothetical protein